jgi:hypothetical protein
MQRFMAAVAIAADLGETDHGFSKIRGLVQFFDMKRSVSDAGFSLGLVVHRSFSNDRRPGVARGCLL